jgi:hypothetical protein
VYGTEAYLYVFDAALMFGVVVAMAVVHPGLLFRVVRKADVMGGEDAGFLLRSQGGK